MIANTIELLDNFRAYFKQARDELALRLADVLFESTGQKNKWWQVNRVRVVSLTASHLVTSFTLQAFSKRKFMGKELKD